MSAATADVTRAARRSSASSSRRWDRARVPARTGTLPWAEYLERVLPQQTQTLTNTVSVALRPASSAPARTPATFVLVPCRCWDARFAIGLHERGLLMVVK